LELAASLEYVEENRIFFESVIWLGKLTDSTGNDFSLRSDNGTVDSFKNLVGKSQVLPFLILQKIFWEMVI
jgi:hypothetical protein